jgi:hypothetical protein
MAPKHVDYSTVYIINIAQRRANPGRSTTKK